MDGIKRLFETFSVINFWDTDNKKKIDNNQFSESQYKQNDWNFYQSKRNSDEKPKSLKLYQRHTGDFWTKDGLNIISPTKELIKNIQSNKEPNWNEVSYVILHEVFRRKILYCGDSGNLAWEEIMKNDEIAQDLENIDILFAPHHGRKTGGDDKNTYIDTISPKLVIFGNTDSSKHKNYAPFNNRQIPILTNNEAGDIIITIKENSEINIQITNNDWESLIASKNTTWKTKLADCKIVLI
ncbi:hypothetical protein CCY99_09255 [Helicobacter sp. 16-1353]|uniref:hypothetical protein n=1 Tax=Helicobacter sp. 16-1353 TaxID=2004996 RepID=UPI000DCEDD42|nr:hypothetical protein [Helicobacter sp. 16-1353]RAX51356.1 hypothetical protein CCY99_09255 [Helicobacter sp. 16-1353]